MNIFKKSFIKIMQLSYLFFTNVSFLLFKITEFSKSEKECDKYGTMKTL